MTPQLQRALAGLNEPQRDAVLHLSSPLLILAGAGSGKTRVITVKIAYLVDELGLDPRSVLAVTFTNKAAGEMRERAAGLVERAAEVTIRTFHSFGAWLLRRNADALGLSRSFSIYDDDDSVTLLRTIFPDHDRRVLNGVAARISRAKDYCLTPDDDLSDISEDPEFRTFYRQYQERLRATGNVDFGDLIMLSVQLLEGGSVTASRLQNRFRYILVDEYQDSNVAQFRLLSALYHPESFLCVVGDDDQSIYRFRGAEVRNILTFPKTFEGTRVVRLEQNYRSTAPILELAGAVVANNEGRLGKTLFTTRAGGSKPRLALLEDQDEEVSFVLDRIRAFERANPIRSNRTGGSDPAVIPSATDRPSANSSAARGAATPSATDRGPELAILYRTNAQSRSFETAFLREGIAYRIVGSLRFYEREEIKDALAFLRFVANPRDEVSLRRVINKPARGLGAKSLDAIFNVTHRADGDLRLAVEYAIPSLPKKAAAGAAAFLRVLSAVDAVLAPDPYQPPTMDEPDAPQGAGRAPAVPHRPRASDATLSDVVERAIRESGLDEYHREHDKIAGSQKHQNLDELVNAAALYPATRAGLIEFLEAIELDSQREQGDSPDARVVLITMHNTKGLEFDHVIITGLEEGLFPRYDDPDELEEERRLFYVAVTRARSELDITSCRYRRVHGRLADYMPSRFLSEIPPELIDVQGADLASAAQDPYLWQRGTHVYHDEYGAGAVVKSWTAGGEACVLVRFQTGATMQFIPRYSSLERVAGDMP